MNTELVLEDKVKDQEADKILINEDELLEKKAKKAAKKAHLH